jgi:L-ascorbate metabolism protein UlaG (beta-lactamase superfamily)
MIHPDIAILPINGDGTLTVQEAVEVVKQMRPRWVIPCNWGPGTQEDARLFKKEVGGRAEVILPSIIE